MVMVSCNSFGIDQHSDNLHGHGPGHCCDGPADGIGSVKRTSDGNKLPTNFTVLSAHFRTLSDKCILAIRYQPQHHHHHHNAECALQRRASVALLLFLRHDEKGMDNDDGSDGKWLMVCRVRISAMKVRSSQISSYWNSTRI